MFEPSLKSCSFHFVLLIFLLGVCAQTFAANRVPGMTATGATYVGSDTCKGCHEDVHKGTKGSSHFQLLSDKESGKPEYQGCESCHGPGSAHVEAGGDKSKIFGFEGASARTATKQCQQCHGSGTEHSNFNQSSHLLNQVGCTSCHSIHKPVVKKALLQAASPTLCYQCHSETRAEFNRPFRHKVNEGLLNCNDCHNVHSATVPKQLRTSASQDQVCMKCHTEKRGPFVYEHVPVKSEGCTSCHLVHGANNARMLRTSTVSVLCLQCHTLSKSNVPSPPPSGPAHNQAQKYQACTLCHPYIHGSNFSEVFFKP